MQYNNIPTTVPEFLKATFIIWIALLIGQIFLITVFSFLIFFSTMETQSSPQLIFLIVGIFLPMILIFASLRMFNQKIENIDKSKNLIDKLIELRTASIIKWATIEGCVFLNLIFFFLTGSPYNLLFGILLLVLFIINAPTKTKIGLALELDQKDIEVLYQK
jgi:hypothetical protein